jgi:ArsR family transcriptional regulator, lead/cadmium/zinc/bismuth-responsive transcriptional repressor
MCDLSWIAERSEKVISHHARALRTAGLAVSRRDGKMIRYSLTEEGHALLEALLAAEVTT